MLPDAGELDLRQPRHSSRQSERADHAAPRSRVPSGSAAGRSAPLSCASTGAPSRRTPPSPLSALDGFAEKRRQAAASKTAVKHGTVALPPGTPGAPGVVRSPMVFCVPPNDVSWPLRLSRTVCSRSATAWTQRRPPSNPAVRAGRSTSCPGSSRAAGLSLDEALARPRRPRPPVRSAPDRPGRQLQGTVQSFGRVAVARGKEDAEELTLLRSLHERDVLRMTKRSVRPGDRASTRTKHSSRPRTPPNRITTTVVSSAAGHNAWAHGTDQPPLQQP